MEESLRAGVATSVITPTLGISLQGSLHDRKSTDVHDELYAKALVLDDGNNPVALIVLDVIAIRDSDVASLWAQVASGPTSPPKTCLSDVPTPTLVRR